MEGGFKDPETRRYSIVDSRSAADLPARVFLGLVDNFASSEFHRHRDIYQKRTTR